MTKLPNVQSQTDPEWPRAEPRDQGGMATARGRTLALSLMFCVGFVALSARAVQIGVFRPVDEAATAARADATPPSNRADIVDRNGQLLATSLVAHSLYADPKRIWDPVETARALRTVFPDLDEAELIAKLSSRSRFEWLKRRLTPKQKQAVWALAQPGLEFIEESDRVYPMGRLGGHVIGSMQPDGKGINGMERAMNDRLMTGDSATPLKLSIDSRIQFLVETELAREASAQRAIGGAGIIMDVRTGEVIASASWPFMDPNKPETNSPNEQNNRATNSRYEMGSTFKVFTVAIGLEDKVITPDTSFDARAPMRIGSETIHDFHGQNKMLSVVEILSHSSNIGTVRIARTVGAPRVKEFFNRIGLMESAGGELAEAARPLLPRRWSDISAATASFGHGIAVSPMAVTAAYGAISNGGHYVRPTFLARDPSSPVNSRQVLSPETSTTIVDLMRKVVTEGTGRRADALGYLVAGKTGTGEKAGPNGYDSNRRVSSFAGVFPANAPRYSILILLDEPKGSVQTGGVATAGMTAAPSVARIIERAAPILGIMPERALVFADAPAGAVSQEVASRASVQNSAPKRPVTPQSNPRSQTATLEVP
jgi:cell division protein FtsI (penicillin-binding protein 3)